MLLDEKLIVEPAPSVIVKDSNIVNGELSNATFVWLVALYEPVAAMFGVSAAVLVELVPSLTVLK